LTRAVIELKEDASGLTSQLEQRIPGFAANPREAVGAFRYKDWRVIVHAREIIAAGVEKEEQAKEIIDYLKGLVGIKD